MKMLHCRSIQYRGYNFYRAALVILGDLVVVEGRVVVVEVITL